MTPIIPVAHDFICPYCWVGWLQVRRMQQEFGVEVEWLGYELWPQSLEWPEDGPAVAPPANRPPTPTKLSLLCLLDGVTIPVRERPKKMRTFNAHQAVEYAKSYGVQDELVGRLYRALWEEGLEINHPDIIIELATGLVPNLDDLRQSMTDDRFGDKVVDFDDDAYSKGIYNVPTYFIGQDRLAEQPYSEVKKALNTFLQQADELTEIYRNIEFPKGVGSRPYTFINMVSTVDGKIITGERDENVSDLGSNYDHFIMHRLENKADGVLVGAGSLRASGSKWNPKTEFRVVVTESGRLDFESEFLKNGTPVVLTTESCAFPFPDSVRVIRLPGNRINWSVAMERLFDLGIKKLNVLGGSVVNSQLFRAEVIDEIFLTIAPKIKLGEGVPTIADGEPLLRSEVKHFNLIEHHRIGSELFLRYRR